MRYFCLTCDYDGTIATDGQVSPSTVEALKRVKSSGRKLVLATGRELSDLLRVFPEISIFDRIVAENGALLYRPASKESKVLSERPPQEFLDALTRRGVPFSAGESIVGTWHPWETAVLDVIRTLGLELQVIFNKNSVMVLPSGVNKATGLKFALAELALSLHNLVGVGDAENDHAFLAICECSAAVSNALPALKARCDWVSQRSHGAGVEELIEQLVTDDLRSLAPRLGRHAILLGRTENGEEVKLDPYGTRLLIAGHSGGGKSTAMAAILERLVAADYQICLIDPEGDYDEFAHFVTLGGTNHVPAISEIFDVLQTPKSLSINLLGIPLSDRPSFFQSLLSRIQDLRSKTGRPHWIVIDEAHHLLPAELESAGLTIPKDLASLAMITAHADCVAEPILSSINYLIAVGTDPKGTISEFSAGLKKNLQPSEIPSVPDRHGSVSVWMLEQWPHPLTVIMEPGIVQLQRHKRKYAEGELGEDKSFYFRGPDSKLNLRAQNMRVFAQTAAGVDDETWNHHLRKSDYSRWIRESVKDPKVADEVAAIERDTTLDVSESRGRILQIIHTNYMTPSPA
jgi:hydroxymethylpyrimidine pyrophosphatase-like HAD family hydrolase